MRRRPVGSKHGDIGLADAAMAVLGPSAFLMIVFLAYAVLNSNERCTELTSDVEASERARQLGSWYGQELSENDRIRATLGKYCRRTSSLREPSTKTSGKSSADPTSELAAGIRIEAAPLAGLCRDDRKKVLDRAKLDEERLATLGQDRHLLSAALQTCIGDDLDKDGKRLPGAEDRARVARQASTWFDGRKRELEEIGAAIGKSCSQIDLKARSSISSPLPQFPPVVAELCRSDRDLVLAAARLSPEAVGKVESDIASLSETLRACSPGVRELGCRTAVQLTADARRRVVAELKDWRDSARKSLAATQSDLAARGCSLPTSAPEKVHNIPPFRTNEVCPASEALLLRDAGISLSEVNDIHATEASIDLALRKCTIEARCRQLDESEQQRLSKELASWEREQLSQSESLTEALASTCGRRTTSRPRSPANALLPPFLTELCSSDEAAVISGAGTTKTSLLRASASRIELAMELGSCASLVAAQSACNRVDPPTMTMYQSRLRDWYAAQVAAVAADEQLAERQKCPRPSGIAVEAPLAVAAFNDGNMCPDQRLELAKTTGIATGHLSALQRRQELVVTRLRGCVSRETVSTVERSARFASCSTDFTRDTREGDESELLLADAEVEQLFDTILSGLIKTLETNSAYNRLEVRGHTDLRPIKTGGCQPVRGRSGAGYVTNAELSASRALRFVAELIRAIERRALKDETGARLLARMDGRRQELLVTEREASAAGSTARLLLERTRPYLEGAVPLRIYAIGVGAQEPLHPEAIPGTAGDRAELHFANRRIEFRFVRDQDVKSTARSSE